MNTVTIPGFHNSNDWHGLFTGRAIELLQIQDALTRNRLAAINGPFGSGKTMLALMAAETLKPKFPGGISIRVADPDADFSSLLAAAFPVKPHQPALLILDEFEHLTRKQDSSVLSILADHPWLSMLIVGTTSPRINGLHQISLSGFSRAEAMDFAQRVTARLGGSVSSSDLSLLIEATLGLPRLLAVTLGLVIEQGKPVGEVVQQLCNFSRAGLVGVDGKPLNSPASSRRLIIDDVRSVNCRLLEMAKADPRLMRSMSPREFEELVAELLSRQGYEVELTPPTKDGGFDMFAAHKNTLGKFLFLVECKRYSETKRVGVEIVRSLHGVVQQHQATAGIIATTSFFTTGAADFQRKIEHQMSLRNYLDIQTWLSDVM
jgi:restriction system protein